MIGDFPIQFSIYTNCPLHHVFLAWEACGRACFQKSIESDFSTLLWIAESEKIRYVYSREIFLSTATIREVNSTVKLSQILRREKDRITRHYGAKQLTTKQTFTTSKHAIEFTCSDFPCHFKVTEINLHWPIIDGCVKEGKRLTITINF